MSDAYITWAVRKIRRLHMQPHRRSFQAIAEALTKRLENAGITEADLDRLGL